MSLPSYKKQYRNPANNSTVTVTGAVFESGKPTNRLETPTDGDRGTNYNYTLFPDFNNFTAVSSFPIEFYYDEELCPSLGAQLCKGVASSASAYMEMVWTHIMDFIATGATTGWRYLNHVSSLASEQQAWLKSYTSEYKFHPYVAFYCTVNTFNPGELSRYVEMGVEVGNTMAIWSSTNNAWATSSEPAIPCFKFVATGSDFVNFKTGFDKIAQSINCIAIAPGPKQAQLQSGTEVTYGSIDTTQDYMSVFYVNEPVCSSAGLTYCMFKTNSNRLGGVNWNSGGSVDPVDPTPTPPDPEPYPPPKPGPDDPPDPVDPVDPVPEPEDPLLDGTNCGIYSVYNPSRTALRQLGGKLWDQNVWDLIKQYFTSPMDAIISLSIIPVTPSTSSPEAIVIGNYNSHIGAPVVNSDYVTFNCGSVYIPRFFGSYLDYDPYTTYKLYLPFIGEVDLNADEITAETITIKYKVNVVSGDCVALCMKNNNVFAEFNGNCARFLPLSQASWSAFVQAAMTFASAAIVGGVSLAGSGATGEAIESSIGATKNGEIRAAANVAQQQSIGANIASSGINAVVGSKISYNKAGRVGQSAGQISVRTPYITITRPNLTLPENIDQASSSALRNYVGYPTNRIGQLSSFHGFTVVEACQLNSQHATEEELAEALEIMKGGVIL